MTDKPWKATERRIAAYLETERNPLSGGNGKQTRSDTLHPALFIEIKHGSGCPKTWSAIVKLFRDTARLAAIERKVPVLVLHRKGSRGVENDDAYFELTDGEIQLQAGPVVCAPLSELKAIFRVLYAEVRVDSEASERWRA